MVERAGALLTKATTENCETGVEVGVLFPPAFLHAAEPLISSEPNSSVIRTRRHDVVDVGHLNRSSTESPFDDASSSQLEIVVVARRCGGQLESTFSE